MSEAPRTPAPATGRQIAKGAAWLMGFKLVDKSIGIVSTLILARLLTPEDFGLVAMAMAVAAFTELMGAFGFDTALIQRQDATAKHYNTAWTFNVIFGALTALTLALLSVPMAHFYDDQRLVFMLLALGVSSLVLGFENIGVVAFRKELDFRSEFRFLLGKRVAGFLVTVAFAFAFRSYWALVAGIVTARAMSVWISYRLHPYRPSFSLAARNELMRFSRWLFLSSLIGFVNARATDFILGRTVGAHGLGVYRVSYEIATMPSTELIAPLNRAVYPAYARLAPDPLALQKRFLEVFGLICLVGLPASAALFAAADAAVRVVLGPKWLETIPLIRLLGLVGLMSALQSNMYLVIVAIGRPRVNTMLSGSLALISLPVIVWASSQYGVLGAAYAMLTQALLGIAGILAVFTRNTRVSIAALWREFWRPALAAIAMASAMLWLDTLLGSSPPAGSHFLRLLVLSTLGLLVYCSLVLALWALCGRPRGPEATVLDTVARMSRAWFKRAPRQA